MSENPPLLSSKPLTRGQRRALSAIVLSQRQAQEPVLANQIRRLQANLRRALVRARSEDERNQAISEYSQGYGKALERLILRLAPLIDKMMVGEKCIPSMETKAISDRFRKWMDRYLANRITFVSDRTKASVREMYAKSDGDYNRFESQLSDYFNPKRAERIARTESGFAMNTSILQISRELSFGQELEKTWMHSGMTNARSTHEDMDGVTIPESDRFSVADPYTGVPDLMRYPCDPFINNPRNTVNCRCTLCVTLKGIR